MRSLLILSALFPVAMAAYLLLAVGLGKWLKARREAMHRAVVDQVLPPRCDCEECDPDPWARLK